MAIKRVLFVVPPDGDEDSFNVETCRLGRYPNFPPYGIGILATKLRAMDIEVRILNLNNEILGNFKAGGWGVPYFFTIRNCITNTIDVFRPDIIGVTCMFSQTHRSLVDVCTQIRFAARVPIVVGGVHITNSLAEPATRAKFLASLPMVNHFFTHEADDSFIEAVKTSFATSDNIVAGTQPTALNTIPAHDLITAPDLAANGKIGSYHCFKPKGTKFSTIIFNRGCRGSCTFCSVRNFNGVGVRGRSIQSVIDELLVLKNDHGISHVVWLDDDFLYDKKATLSLFNEIVKQDVNITWDCTNGVIASSCTDEVIGAAAAAGCLGLHIGMESGNPDILRRIKKPGTVKTFLKAAEVLRRYETINSRIFLMIGFPGETFSQVKDTYDVALEMNLDWCNITQLQALPNTAIFEEVAPAITSLSDIKFSAGAYGKHRKSAEANHNLMAADYKNVMQDSTAIPTAADQKLLWAYMNYNLNFERLYTVTSPVKLAQQLAYLNYIADEVAPDDPIAQQFRTYLKTTLDKSTIL